MNTENPPAFPGESDHQSGSQRFYSGGMTLRDYFAAKAMQGWLANPSAWEPTQSDKTQDSFLHFAKVAAVASYSFADAMLEERSKK